MEKFELLDRFELLYPHIEKLAELRRLYIDKDLRDFRLLDMEESDLRSAVMDENIQHL